MSALPVPTCTPRAAFQAAVASGVPRDVVATLIYHYTALSPTVPLWGFDVPGHEGGPYMREIDGHTCKIVYKPTK
jgi:hypothetical protein